MVLVSLGPLVVTPADSVFVFLRREDRGNWSSLIGVERELEGRLVVGDWNSVLSTEWLIVNFLDLLGVEGLVVLGEVVTKTGFDEGDEVSIC
jgi:hypothetical protein